MNDPKFIRGDAGIEWGCNGVSCEACGLCAVCLGCAFLDAGAVIVGAVGLTLLFC